MCKMQVVHKSCLVLLRSKVARCSSLRRRSTRTSVVVRAMVEPLDPSKIKVVACGGAGVDYLASIAEFPRPDDKLRTDALEVQGGGNSGNQATCAARLGLHAYIVTKIGGDGLGQGILDEFARDGVATDFVLQAPNHPSPFTYIIVDRKGGTRTCIHTPGAPLDPSEMTPELLQGALDGASLVWFDGRLTEAALVLAKEARRRGVPILVEAERLRPNLDLLLQEADYVATSANFPEAWTGEETVGDAMLELLHRLPRVKLVVTTLGAKGAVLIEKVDAPAGAGASSPVALDSMVTRLLSEVGVEKQKQEGAEPVVTSVSGVKVGDGAVKEGGVVAAAYSEGRSNAAAAARAKEAAARAASLNSDASKADRYEMGGAATATAAPAPVWLSVVVGSAARLPEGSVSDTTGAGDAFIGSLVYGLCTGLSRPATLKLAAVVAAAKCTALGARPGLPMRSDISQELLV